MVHSELYTQKNYLSKMKKQERLSQTSKAKAVHCQENLSIRIFKEYSSDRKTLRLKT